MTPRGEAKTLEDKIVGIIKESAGCYLPKYFAYENVADTIIKEFLAVLPIKELESISEKDMKDLSPEDITCILHRRSKAMGRMEALADIRKAISK